MQMEFLAPQESTSSIYFMFQKTKKGTQVTWGYDESHPIMVSFMINLDHQLGELYEEGLRNLREIVE